MALVGRCLCGELAWEVEGPPRYAGYCHCAICRKHSGAALSAAGGYAPAAFRWRRGGGAAAANPTRPGRGRGFCPRCGSKVPGAVDEGETVVVPYGTLEGDPGLRPQAHIFVASAPPWGPPPEDGLPRFEAYPPGFREDPGLEAPLRPRGEPGTIGGSCLCGAVAYAIRGEPETMRHCHCSRCRRSRGGPHATNLFAPAEAFRWEQGEGAVRRFDLPEAERFGTAFCARCGGLVPRLPEGAASVNVPAGSLDDDPGIRPSVHIHVASKAAWLEIADALPRFPVGPA